ncbi:MAG: hypothetical protein NVS4B6_28280 [Mycobacterium sp.]
MKTSKFTITLATIGTLAATALGLAGAAAAAPTGANSSAANTVKHLQAEGYSVQINGQAGAPLKECTVSDVHGLSNSNSDSDGRPIDPTQFTTVYVDIECPDES